jgi:cardiolipin synthase
VDLVLRIALLGIIPHNRKPSSAMAWLLLVLLVPFLGLAIFLLLGRAEIGRHRHAKQAEVNALIRQRTTNAPALPLGATSPYVESVITLNRNLGALPASSGNAVTLHSDYRESIEAMTAAVEGAQHFVHVQFYITAWDPVTDPFFDALVRATERGVTVRLLFDYLGSKGIPGYKAMLARLDQTKIIWPARSAQPPQDPRRRRGRGVHGLPEPHRARLRQAEEPSGRARMGRAHLPGHRSRRGGAGQRVRHGLVQRDR